MCKPNLTFINVNLHLHTASGRRRRYHLGKQWAAGAKLANLVETGLTEQR
jgi:hypothetical protein